MPYLFKYFYGKFEYHTDVTLGRKINPNQEVKICFSFIFVPVLWGIMYVFALKPLTSEQLNVWFPHTHKPLCLASMETVLFLKKTKNKKQPLSSCVTEPKLIAVRGSSQRLLFSSQRVHWEMLWKSTMELSVSSCSPLLTACNLTWTRVIHTCSTASW